MGGGVLLVGIWSQALAIHSVSFVLQNVNRMESECSTSTNQDSVGVGPVENKEDKKWLN